MKKFTKFVLILILVMGVIGGGLFGAGLMTGGSTEAISGSFVNSNLYHAITRVYRNHEKSWDDIDDDFKNRHCRTEDFDDLQYANIQQRAFLPSEIDSLDIEMYSGSVEIRVIPENEIRISGLSDQDFLELDIEEKELTVESESRNNGNREGILVELPENKIFSSFDIYVESGEVKSTGKLSVKECDLTLMAGKMQIELLDAQETDIEMISGDFSITQTGKLDDYAVWVECASGHFVLDGEKYSGTTIGEFGNIGSSKKIDIESKSGSVAVNFENQ